MKTTDPRKKCVPKSDKEIMEQMIMEQMELHDMKHIISESALYHRIRKIRNGFRGTFKTNLHASAKYRRMMGYYS